VIGVALVRALSSGRGIGGACSREVLCLLYGGFCSRALRHVPVGARRGAAQQQVDGVGDCLDVGILLGRDVADEVVERLLLLPPRKSKDWKV
jgi:hypothetical protein